MHLGGGMQMHVSYMTLNLQLMSVTYQIVRKKLHHSFFSVVYMFILSLRELYNFGPSKSGFYIKDQTL